MEITPVEHSAPSLAHRAALVLAGVVAFLGITAAYAPGFAGAENPILTPAVTATLTVTAIPAASPAAIPTAIPTPAGASG